MYMKEKKKSKINLKKGFNNLKTMIKKSDKKKLNKLCLSVVGIVVLIVVFSLVLSPIKYNKNMKTLREWAVADDYSLGDAMDKAIVHSKWREKDNIITVTGKDRKTRDKVVIKFKMGTYMSFDSMTIGEDSKDYKQWLEYLMTYHQ